MIGRLKSLYKNMVWLVVRPVNIKEQTPIVTEVTSNFQNALKEARKHGGFIIPAFRDKP